MHLSVHIPLQVSMALAIGCVLLKGALFFLCT